MGLFLLSLTQLMTRYFCFSLCSYLSLITWSDLLKGSFDRFFRGWFPAGNLIALKCHPSSLTGRCCHLHDLHHRPAYCVCGHWADLQRPAQPQCTCCGQRSDEGLNGYVLLLTDRHNEANYTFTALLWDVPALLTCRCHPPVLPSLFCIKRRTYVIHRILLSE